MSRSEKVKRKIVVVSLLALVVSFGGRWMTRTEPTEEMKQASSYEAAEAVSEPTPPTLIIQPQVAVESSRQMASFNPTRASADWRERAAQYEPLIQSAALRHGVDARWLWIIAYLETRFRPELVSPKGARGLMQLMPGTAARFGVTNIWDPQQNIEGGTRYMRFLLDKFNGDVSLALAGYNAGEGAVMKYGYNIPPYSETREYVRRITKRYSLIRDPYTAGQGNRLTQEQIALVQAKESAPLSIYERSVFAVQLPDGRRQLVSQ
jgi:soluble lytic murein transglycosylase-like protein